MKIIPVSELYGYNFSVEVINTLRLFWHDRDTFNCMDKPKKTDILVYLDNCRAEYTLPNGERILAEPGSLVYAPAESRYLIRIFDRKDPYAGTVGTNFLLLDHMREPFLLSDSITVFSGIDCRNLVSELAQISASMVPSPARMKARFYDILMRLCDDHRMGLESRFQIIVKGIRYLENDPDQTLSIAEIAAMCNISEIYFRRLFKAYAGLSPIDYRINSKLERSKQLLRYEDLTTEQIAALLHFSTPSYFCKQFKKHTGRTPSEYRRCYNPKDK